MICFTLANSWVSVGFSYLSRDFWSALNTKDAETFYPTLGKFAIALTGGAPIAVLYRFYREKLSLQWRAWMTLRILDMWKANRSYYDLEMKGELDNPDQRIAEDAASFTDVSLDFSIKIATSVIDLVNFSGILYSIYPQLFGAIIAYASFGTGMTIFIGRSLVQTNFQQLQREADFRFSLVRMRENAESIAFYGGEAQEIKEIKARLGRTIDNSFQLAQTQRNLELFTVGYRYMVQVIRVVLACRLVTRKRKARRHTLPISAAVCRCMMRAVFTISIFYFIFYPQVSHSGRCGVEGVWRGSMKTSRASQSMS